MQIRPPPGNTTTCHLLYSQEHYSDSAAETDLTAWLKTIIMKSPTDTHRFWITENLAHGLLLMSGVCFDFYDQRK